MIYLEHDVTSEGVMVRAVEQKGATLVVHAQSFIAVPEIQQLRDRVAQLEVTANGARALEDFRPPYNARNPGRHIFLMSVGYMTQGLEPVCQICGRAESDPVHEAIR